MIPVTKEQFFAYVGPRDIILRTERQATIWETRNRLEVGRSTPGYMCEGPTTYALAPSAAATVK